MPSLNFAFKVGWYSNPKSSIHFKGLALPSNCGPSKFASGYRNIKISHSKFTVNRINSELVFQTAFSCLKSLQKAFHPLLDQNRLLRVLDCNSKSYWDASTYGRPCFVVAGGSCTIAEISVTANSAPPSLN